MGAGFLAGIINTLAGSGSLITLPALIFAGLPAPIANGTNRIAILLQCFTALRGFHRSDKLELRPGLYLSIPAIAGALLGAFIAVDIDAQTMETMIGCIMLLMLAVIILQPGKWLHGNPALRRPKPSLMQSAALFAIGVYGGFIQAGIGILLLAGLVLSAGFDLVRANALKLLIVLIYTPFAIAVFIWNDQVDWLAAAFLSAGNIAGALVATRIAVTWGPRLVRWILILVVIASAVFLLEGAVGRLWDWI